MPSIGVVDWQGLLRGSVVKGLLRGGRLRALRACGVSHERVRNTFASKGRNQRVDRGVPAAMAGGGERQRTNDEQLEAMPGWFAEISSFWKGQAMALKVDKVEHRERTECQDLMVFRSEAYGRVMALDGAIQLTDKDEFAYQEMITHLPLCTTRSSARRVLVVGGGDGGVLRELCRHDWLEKIDVAEVDARVIEVAREFFPSVVPGLNDPRVTFRIMDGAAFVQNAESDSYDAVIVDSSDPVGPAAELFTQSFYQQLARVVRPGGVVCAQGECMWIHLGLIRDVAKFCRQCFSPGSVGYAITSVPTYPCGQIGFMVCSKGDNETDPANLFDPVRPVPEPSPSQALLPLRYYNPSVHRHGLQFLLLCF